MTLESYNKRMNNIRKAVVKCYLNCQDNDKKLVFDQLNYIMSTYVIMCENGDIMDGENKEYRQCCMGQNPLWISFLQTDVHTKKTVEDCFGLSKIFVE